MATDVCSNCHPAYTGVARAVASGSRIARFNRRRALATHLAVGADGGVDPPTSRAGSRDTTD